MDEHVTDLHNPAISPTETASPPPDVLVTGYFKQQYGYATYRSHGSGNWLITYTISGQGRYRQPGISLNAQPGDIILLQPGALHDYAVPEHNHWEFLWAHFQPRVDWLTWWHIPEVGKGLFHIHLAEGHIRERIQQAFLRLHMDSSMLSAPHHEIHPNRLLTYNTVAINSMERPLGILQRELALNGLEEILLLITRECARIGSKKIDGRVQYVLDLMRNDLAGQHTLHSLAQQVALSPSRLSHLFKEEVGDSVQHMLLTLRLNTAARLLEFTTHSIQMIASEVGFRSAFYFTRQFHRRFGMSPRDYRLQAQGHEE